MVSGRILWGPLLEAAGSLPLSFSTSLCNLKSRFLEKGQVGRGYRAIARNGKVLLASNRPVGELTNRTARVRLQSWHKAILPGEAPAPYGVLFCIRCEEQETQRPPFVARFVQECEEPFALALDVGGGLVMEFRERS
jgi:hypothetical protein